MVAAPIVARHTTAHMRITEQLVHPEPSETDVQKAAYYLWLERGRPEGCDLEVWLAAKERLRHRPAEIAGRIPRPVETPRRARRARISNSN